MYDGKMTNAVRDKLTKPFTDNEMEWRVQSAGANKKGKWAQVVPYIKSRAIMDRLDDVLGLGGWQDSYRETHISGTDGYVAGLGIKCGDEWVWKFDGAPSSDFESIKGGISGALKRAAVKWGVGRYLYSMGAEFVDVHDGYAPDDDGNYIRISQKQKGDRPAIYGWASAPGQGEDRPKQTPDKIEGMEQRAKKKPTGSIDGIKAKYNTCCSACGEWHDAGTIITKYGENNKGGQGWAAVDCLNKEVGKTDDEPSGDTKTAYELEERWCGLDSSMSGPKVNEARLAYGGTINMEEMSPAGLKNYIEHMKTQVGE